MVETLFKKKRAQLHDISKFYHLCLRNYLKNIKEHSNISDKIFFYATQQIPGWQQI